MQFLLLLMNLVTDSAELLEMFTKDVLFWGKPARSILMMNVSIFGCLIVYLALRFLPLGLITVVIIWVITLKNSEFFSNLAVALIKRQKRVDTDKLIKS